MKNLTNIFMFLLILFLCEILCGCNSKNTVELSTESYNEEINQVSSESNIFVYITGQVHRPGVYQVSEGTRLYQVVELAGGMTKKAQKNAVNLAEEVTDGQSVHIPSKRNNIEQYTSETNNGLININQATVEQLMTLPGIGESKAMAIQEYRKENGKFESVEDIKNVSGIGDSTFNNLKDLITI